MLGGASEPGLDGEPSPGQMPDTIASNRSHWHLSGGSAAAWTSHGSRAAAPLRRAAWPTRLPIPPRIPAPIPAPLVLAPAVAFSRTPAPVVRMNDHVRLSRIAVDLLGMPANVAAADNGGRRARSG